jgi:hypothetical protein
MCSLVLYTCWIFGLSGSFVPQNGPCNLATCSLDLPCTLTCSSPKKDLYLCVLHADITFTNRFPSLCRRPCANSFSCESCSPKNRPSFSFTHCRFPMRLAARLCLASSRTTVVLEYQCAAHRHACVEAVVSHVPANTQPRESEASPLVTGMPSHCASTMTPCCRPWWVSHQKMG